MLFIRLLSKPLRISILQVTQSLSFRLLRWRHTGRQSTRFSAPELLNCSTPLGRWSHPHVSILVHPNSALRSVFFFKLYWMETIFIHVFTECDLRGSAALRWILLWLCSDFYWFSDLKVRWFMTRESEKEAAFQENIVAWVTLDVTQREHCCLWTRVWPSFLHAIYSFILSISRDLKDLGVLVLPIKPGPHDGHAGDLVRGK